MSSADAVDHGGVDHLALARPAGLDQGGADPEGEQHAAAAEVADEVERRHRRLAAAADRLERAGQRDVVDVVAGGVRVRARPGPSRSCGRRRASGCGSRHTSGPRPSRSITPGRKPSMSASACSTRSSTVATPSGCFRSTPIERRPRFSTSAGGVAGSPPCTLLGAVDPDDVGAQVGEHHRAERPGADPRDLEHLDAGEGSASTSS